MSSSPSGAQCQPAPVSAALPGRSRHQSRLVSSGGRHGRCLAVLVAILGTLGLTRASRPADSDAGLDLDVGGHIELSADTETQPGTHQSEGVKVEHSEEEGTSASSKECESFRSQAKNSKEAVEAFYKKCIEKSEAQFRETDSLLNEARGKERDYAQRLAELDLVTKSLAKVKFHAKDAEVKEEATLKKDLDLGD
eukprot:TRINITY_DN76023_c0_g1_i1.p1 TRINITY_DN76023_c0_g1~~TRINITY_DN76023_c0_g1_i1.p1  ORF type:complete len:195 (+),score=44.69 TRINITY_DN76023_c0_g1_i1:77-661(+)